MKKIVLLFFTFSVTVCLLTGCSHNVSQLGMGSQFRVGSGEFALSYSDGLFLNSVNRENMRFEAELDSTVGAAYDPVTGTYKGIKAIAIETGPQVTGYLADLAKASPEAVTAYYEALKAYYQAGGSKPAQPLISEEKSKEASKSISEVIKEALAKAKSIVNGRSSAKGTESVFSCDGDCEYTDLTGNASIDYQLSIATKLLEYDGDQRTFESTDERYKTTLEHFISELIYYRSRGHVNTPLRIKYVTVEDKVITKLMYAYFPKDEPSREVDCPSCVPMLDEDSD